MKLKYALDEKVFHNKEAFEKSVKMVKDGEIEIDDLELLIDAKIEALYKDLSTSFPYGTSDFNSIYKREVVTEYIDKFYSEELDTTYHYFHILLDNGIISVCGSGYMFDYKENVVESNV